MGVLRGDYRVRTLSAAIVSLVLATTWFSLPGALRANGHDTLVVIVGRSLSANDITVSLLRQTFRGERVQLAGKHLIPFNHRLDSHERVLFDRTVLSLEPGDVGPFWIRSKIRDEGSPPRQLPSPAVGPRVVASFLGAITYMRSSAVDSSVKVLTIDGKAPGTQGYLFPDL